MSQTAPPLPALSSSFGHVSHDGKMNRLTLPSQTVDDLPSWTPLRTLDNDEGSLASDLEVDEFSTRIVAKSPMKRHARPSINARATVEVAATTGQTAKPWSDAKPPKRRARFDGVLIARKPLPHRKLNSVRTHPGRAPVPSAQTFSLVDALARTFDANRHTEGSFPHPSLAASRQHDDASTGLQTDVETTEDERIQLNTRLAPTSLKRQRVQPRIVPASENVSETNSEGTTPLVPGVLRSERPVKRLKTIQYESNSASIDAALGTIQAPISWDAELDIITRDEDYYTITPAQIARAAPTSADAPVAVDASAGHAAGSSPSARSLASIPTGNALHFSGSTRSKTVLSPYLSRGAKFRQRLEATFGANATVRTDRVARPRPVDLELYATLDEPEHEREPSPNVSESTASAGSASTVEEEGTASAVPSTHVTSQSSDVPPADTNADQLASRQLDEAEADAPTRPTPETHEERVNSWIVALQRLVKGKVHLKEEDLETLSIILAEIESVRNSLDRSDSVTSELRTSVKQLSELHEIPFGDRNKLRKRAANIVRTWPSIE